MQKLLLKHLVDMKMHIYKIHLLVKDLSFTMKLDSTMYQEALLKHI